MSSRPAVSIRAVSKRWTPEGRAPVQALRDLTFDVAPGEFIVLLGPSGCGKSTLLYMIAGLEDVSGGTIFCDGEPVTEPSAERGLIFQEASLFPWLTIADNVAFGLAVQHVQPVRRREIAIEMLKACRPRRHAGQEAGRAIGRHAPARRLRKGTRHAAESADDGRALRRARRSNPRPHAGFPAADLARQRRLDPPCHPLHRRGRYRWRIAWLSSPRVRGR